jgi:hypothetical protein
MTFLICISRSKTVADSSSKPSDGVKDFERQLQELFDEVKMMIKMGNKNDAMDLLQANYEFVKEQINAGSSGIEEAATLDIIDLGYMAIGDLKSVGFILNKVTFFFLVCCVFNVIHVFEILC